MVWLISRGVKWAGSPVWSDRLDYINGPARSIPFVIGSHIDLKHTNKLLLNNEILQRSKAHKHAYY